MRALLFALLASCAVDPAPPEACHRILDAYCDAVKECGGNVSACLARRNATCPTATAAHDQDGIDRCVVAMGPHTCALTEPVFTAAGAMCLAMYQ